MPKLAANLTMMFNELPFHERPAAAAKAGFKGVEYLFPYDYSQIELKAWNDAAGVEQVLINCPAGNREIGERGLCCLPDRIAEFREGITRAINYAVALDCPRIHIVAGLAPGQGPERAVYAETYMANLGYAAEEFAKQGLIGLLEPLNSRDVPGFYLSKTGQALKILDELRQPNLKLQFDFYHVQIMEGDLARRFRDCVDRVGHIQIANPPDRLEPDKGEINYDYILKMIDATGYEGWVSCEYKPEARTESGLGWGEAYGLKPSLPKS